MNVIFKQALKFKDASKVHKDILVQSSPSPVEVPDWVVRTPTYLVNRGAGLIIEINPRDAEKVEITRAEHQEYLTLKRLHGNSVESKNARGAESYREMERRNAENLRSRPSLIEDDAQVGRVDANPIPPVQQVAMESSEEAKPVPGYPGYPGDPGVGPVPGVDGQGLPPGPLPAVEPESSSEPESAVDLAADVRAENRAAARKLRGR